MQSDFACSCVDLLLQCFGLNFLYKWWMIVETCKKCRKIQRGDGNYDFNLSEVRPTLSF